MVVTGSLAQRADKPAQQILYLTDNMISEAGYLSTWCWAKGPNHGRANHSPCSALIESSSQMKNRARLINVPVNIHMKSQPNIEASRPSTSITTTIAQKKMLWKEWKRTNFRP